MDIIKLTATVIVVFLLQVPLCFSHCKSHGDLTRVPESNGPSVVIPFVTLIEKFEIFPDDYQILRRIAFVETADSIKQSTYRPYYHGGMWAVNEGVFLSTKTSNVTIQNQVQSFFGIKRLSVEWNGLQKPLYSALVPRIYINEITQNVDIDLSQISNQVSFWAATYNRLWPGETVSYSSAANTLDDYQNGKIMYF